MYAMFEDPLFSDVDPVVLPHPNAFDRVGGPDAPDVIVTNDWITGQWPERDRANMVKHLDAGKGLIVLHHAVGTNNDAWAWWSEEVIGCYLYNANAQGMKTQARLKQFVRQTIKPVGDSPDRARPRTVHASMGRNLPEHVDLAEIDRAVRIG